MKQADVWEKDLSVNIKELCAFVSKLYVCAHTWMWGRRVVNKRQIISTAITTVFHSVLILCDFELLFHTENCYELWQIVNLKVRQPGRGFGLLAVSNFIFSFITGTYLTAAI